MHPGEETCLGEAGSHMPADSSCKGTRMQGWAVCTLRYTDCKVLANSQRMVSYGLHSTVWTSNRYGTAAYGKLRDDGVVEYSKWARPRDDRARNTDGQDQRSQHRGSARSTDGLQAVLAPPRGKTSACSTDAPTVLAAPMRQRSQHPGARPVLAAPMRQPCPQHRCASARSTDGQDQCSQHRGVNSARSTDAPVLAAPRARTSARSTEGATALAAPMRQCSQHRGPEPALAAPRGQQCSQHRCASARSTAGQLRSQRRRTRTRARSTEGQHCWQHRCARPTLSPQHPNSDSVLL